MTTLPKFLMTLVFSFLFILIGGCDDDDNVAKAVVKVGITLSRTALSAAENAATAEYTIKLKVEPASNMEITPESGDEKVATVAAKDGTFPLTFTSDNWETAQSVVVTTVDDKVDQGANNRTVKISHVFGVGFVTAYLNDISEVEVLVTATDDDTKGVTVLPSSLAVPEDAGTGTYSVKLNSQPAADVIVTYVSASTNVVTVTGSSLTFTDKNWGVAQNVTVTGVSNSTYSATPQRSVIGHTVTGSADYSGMVVGSVTVTATDNESAPAPAGITLNPATAEISEDAGTVDYTVVLNKAPVSDLTLVITSSDVGAVTLKKSVVMRGVSLFAFY